VREVARDVMRGGARGGCHDEVRMLIELERGGNDLEICRRDLCRDMLHLRDKLVKRILELNVVGFEGNCSNKKRENRKKEREKRRKEISSTKFWKRNM
jgi:hypothetical protein